jgi:ActR/RegA family two-component response regulator
MSHTKVLLVDDEVEFVSALAERLQLRNYEVKTRQRTGSAWSHSQLYARRGHARSGDTGMSGMKRLRPSKFDPTIEVIM